MTETRSLKCLWLSRHPLDGEAIAALESPPSLDSDDRGGFGSRVEIIQREIIWPADEAGVREAFEAILNEGFDILAGVYPSQAVEYICHLREEEAVLSATRIDIDKVLAAIAAGRTKPVFIMSPVSAPAAGEEGRLRPFKFIRWATLAVVDVEAG